MLLNGMRVIKFLRPIGLENRGVRKYKIGEKVKSNKKPYVEY